MANSLSRRTSRASSCWHSLSAWTYFFITIGFFGSTESDDAKAFLPRLPRTWKASFRYGKFSDLPPMTIYCRGIFSSFSCHLSSTSVRHTPPRQTYSYTAQLRSRNSSTFWCSAATIDALIRISSFASRSWDQWFPHLCLFQNWHCYSPPSLIIYSLIY